MDYCGDLLGSELPDTKVTAKSSCGKGSSSYLGSPLFQGGSFLWPLLLPFISVSHGPKGSSLNIRFNHKALVDGVFKPPPSL